MTTKPAFLEPRWKRWNFCLNETSGKKKLKAPSGKGGLWPVVVSRNKWIFKLVQELGAFPGFSDDDHPLLPYAILGWWSEGVRLYDSWKSLRIMYRPTYPAHPCVVTSSSGIYAREHVLCLQHVVVVVLQRGASCINCEIYMEQCFKVLEILNFKSNSKNLIFENYYSIFIIPN